MGVVRRQVMGTGGKEAHRGGSEGMEDRESIDSGGG